jgi:hypothetical protein
MTKNLQKIYKAFGGKINGTKRTQQVICETLALMPQQMIDHITSDCWFLSSTDDAWAFTFHGDDVVGKHMIFLSDDLLSQSPSQIRWTIAHEIGHIILNHKNDIGIGQTKSEIDRQEKEADEFALQFVPKPLI